MTSFEEGKYDQDHKSDGETQRMPIAELLKVRFTGTSLSAEESSPKAKQAFL
jgi:hypothetical protein